MLEFSPTQLVMKDRVGPDHLWQVSALRDQALACRPGPAPGEATRPPEDAFQGRGPARRLARGGPALRGSTVHVVASGDTLGGLARRYLGGMARAEAIFLANRDQLDDLDEIFVGQRLRIPDPDIQAEDGPETLKASTS